MFEGETLQSKTGQNKVVFQISGKKHPKYIFKSFFHSTLFVCVSWFKLQYISLKDIFSKWLFLLRWAKYLRFIHSDIHQTLVYSYLYSQGFHRGGCSCVNCLVYSTFYSLENVEIYFSWLLTVFSDLWSDKKEISSITSAKWNYNFQPGFMQC